jgi:1L-myo-inositol 1-phosphate cytidylyltransferase / CDP-L-myo-inositol myo-inositolphosphotransferase
MERSDIEVILLADAPEALVELCGVTLLERLLRILQRLDFRHPVVLSATAESIGAELAKPSWARQNVNLDLVPRAPGPVEAAVLSRIVEESLRVGTRATTPERWLVIPAGIYCDARLLEALRDQNMSAVLIDSDPPEIARPLVENFRQTTRGRLCGPTLLTKNSVSTFSPRGPFLDQVEEWIDTRKIDVVDAATEPDYIVSMRRHLRPLCFPAPSPNNHRLAERLVLDTAQNGTLDLPAYIHAPIENRIVSRLCQTRITPNQITIFNFIIGCAATIAFAMGHLWLGTVIALVFGVVDGLDGKQARVKIETTARGSWEHQLDYLIENSWWAALALRLWSSGQSPNAFYFLALLIGSDLVDRLAKRQAKIATGRQLDDFAPFDRAFRLIAGRRNIYVWMLALGLLLGAVGQAFTAICMWAAVTATIHLLRCIWIGRHPPTRSKIL